MNECLSNGMTFAERASMSVNRMIGQMGIRFSSGTTIRDSANIVIIGYGGTENKENVKVLRSGSIATLFNDDTIPVLYFKEKLSNLEVGSYEIDCELKQFTTPKAWGDAVISSALDITRALLAKWMEWTKEYRDDDGNIVVHDDLLYPVPVIINFTSANIQVTNQAIELAKRIMNIELPDGNPLVINCIYDKRPAIMGFPSMSKYVDLQYKEFSSISSSIPNEILHEMKDIYGFPYVKRDSKFLFLNPDYGTLGSLIQAILWSDDRGTGPNIIMR